MTRPVVGYAGLTHLGLVSAAASASKGFRTVGFDPNAALVTRIASGDLPIAEPDLDLLLREHGARLSWSADTAALGTCDVVYIASDVPTDGRGISDLTGITVLIEQVAAALKPGALLVVLCQVPPGFTRALPLSKDRVFYQVETLVFGRAIERATLPERFIVGLDDPARALPAPWRTFLEGFGAPILPMRYESAELCKIAINCCLVAQVSVANTLAGIAERIGADWREIVPALRLDRRIGEHAYLAPGLGLSGGNLERDLATVISLAEETGAEASIIPAFIANSRHRRAWALGTLHETVLGRTRDAVIGILGLAYKEHTHSTKNSPALFLLDHLGDWPVRLYDPLVPAEATGHPRATECRDAAAVADGVDALVLMTPWPQFRQLDPHDLRRRMRGRAVIDPYGLLDGARVAAAGLDHFTLGAPPRRTGHA
jgi:UDPglucose 6-dehydrogenase